MSTSISTAVTAQSADRTPEAETGDEDSGSSSLSRSLSRLSSSIIIIPPTSSTPAYPPPFQSANDRPPSRPSPSYEPDLSLAVAFFLLLASHLGLVSQRYPEVRRRERLAYAEVWRERAKGAKEGARKAAEDVGEFGRRAAEITADDARAVADLTRAYLPNTTIMLTSLVSSIRSRLTTMYHDLPALPRTAEARAGLSTMVAQCMDIDRIGEVLEEDIVSLRIMARRYAPSLSALLTTALHTIRSSLPPSVVRQLPTLPTPCAPLPPSEVPPMEDEPPDWGIRSLPSSPSRRGSSSSAREDWKEAIRYAPVVQTQAGGDGGRERRLRGAMGDVMPGLEEARRAWLEEELD